MEIAMGRRPTDLVDPAYINPEQLTSTSTKQDLLNEEFQKLATCKHISKSNSEKIVGEILQNEWSSFRPDLRLGERAFLLARSPE